MNVRVESALSPVDIIFAPFKFMTFLCTVLVFLIHHSLISFFTTNEDKRQKYFLRSIRLYAKIGQKILNIKINKHHEKKELHGSLIVANHLSYIDVLILFSQYPSLFITSVGIKETFLLGKISQLAGCFFVERRKSLLSEETKAKEVNEMKAKLKKGFNVFLFPEGTSSSGARVLPFKAHFFQLAENGVPIVPICLKYKGESSDVVPWYGSMTFPDHLFKVCLLRSIEAEITELSQISSADRFELSKTAHNRISECYG